MNKNKPASVLVCVTDQPSCRRLILAGSRLAESYNTRVQVVSVLPEGLISEKTAGALQKLYDTSGALGAEMTVFFNNEPALTAAVHASQIDAIHLVSGAPGPESNLFIETIRQLLPELPISIVDADDRLITFPALPAAVNATLSS
ncbi:MAG: hypothetical protein HFJ80_04440 [Clostridiales bacterium]|nr:hypothetical protein [Clostridiales bacterium]